MDRVQTPVFGLLTDFGFDYAVASMKGVISQSFPDAQIIDVDHNLKKFSVISGAFVIRKSHFYFADNTIFICIVDPGVGSVRDMICIRVGNQWFVGPDNGVFHYLFNYPDVLAYRIIRECFGASSHTFHGRDLFTPAAVRLAQGRRDFLVPITINALTMIRELDQQSVVTYIDSFGNIKTNIEIMTELKPGVIVSLSIDKQKHKIRWQSTFADVPYETLLCYKGSNNTLEIALNGGSAQKYFNIDVGTPIDVIME